MIDHTRTEPRAWREISVWFTTWWAAQRAVTDTMGPRLAELEANGTIILWWFVRKGVEWRIRYLVAPSRGETAAETLTRTLEALTAAGRCSRWADTIYEPPTAVFGGPDALAVADKLLHADSRHILTHLASGGGHQRALGVVLTAAMLRAARRDWYDQGHVWRLLTRQRTAPVQPPTPTATTALRRLLAADPDPGRLCIPSAWFTAFTRTGAIHSDLDRRPERRASRTIGG